MKSISTKDYYNTNGNLLLAKGIPMTLEMIQKLQRYHLAGTEEAIGNRTLEKENYIKQMKLLKTRFTGFKAQTLNYVNDLLINIIFDSKQTPWWMYVNALSNYIDWIYTHSIDVAMISMMMAEALHYPEENIRELGLGALLHDVGKLLIPKRILQQTLPLPEMEKMIIRQHCELGSDSMSGCSLSEASMKIIIQHHERLDGSGYPNSLKADDIHPYAKIVMLADVLDALTAGRPYKNSMKTEEAINLLINQNTKYSEEYLMVMKVLLV